MGTTKEIIHQVSHSKKWASEKVIDEHGKAHLVRSYSLLQDRFFQHMRDAGFEGFERGERGSTAEHLSVLDYKIQQDTEWLEDLSKQTEREKKTADHLVETTKVLSHIAATQDEIDGMAKPGKSGKNKIVANADWEKVSSMAKRCELLYVNIEKMKDQITALQHDREMLRRDRDIWKNNYTRLWNEVKEFIGAIRSIPNRLRESTTKRIPVQIFCDYVNLLLAKI